MTAKFPCLEFNKTATSNEEIYTAETLREAIKKFTDASYQISWKTQDMLDAMMYAFKQPLECAINLDKLYVANAKNPSMLSDKEWDDIMKKIGGEA